MSSLARLLLWAPAAPAALQLCMDVVAPFESATPCCEAPVANPDGHYCCESASTSMCFDEGEQLFWRTFNRSTTLYYKEWHLAAQPSAPGSYYARDANYFAEPDHPRLNYAETEITVSPAGEDRSALGLRGDAARPSGAAAFELCMDVVAPLEADARPCCRASANEDGHWCCEAGSLRMCLDEGAQLFWRTFNRSTTLYYHEWHVATPTPNRASYYARSSNYFAEPDHPRLNFASTEIVASPVAAEHETVLV